jgi:hypothetical protein
MASVFQRDDRWQAKFKNERGQWATRSCGDADKATAQRWAAAWEAEARDTREGRIDLKAATYRQHALRPLADQIADWRAALVNGFRDLAARVNLRRVRAISFGSQLDGLVCVDANAQPVGPAIIWMDRRADPLCRQAAARVALQGASPLRVMFSELLPNIASSVLVFFALIIASNILTEAGLSFLGAGVQPPNPSWGTLIADGQSRIVTAPWLAIIPGIAIVLTVLSLNIFGDGLRDALDPRAKVRMER